MARDFDKFNKAFLDLISAPKTYDQVCAELAAIEMTRLPQRDPRRAPSHPGVLLRKDVLPGLGLSVSEAAQHLGVTRQQLHRILAERSAISPEMAIRVGKLCGNGPGLWLRMQVAHDLWHAQQKLGRKINAIPTLKATRTLDDIIDALPAERRANIKRPR